MNNYEEIISKYDFMQLVYERAILLKQNRTLQKQFAILDEEFKRRLENGNNV